MPVFAILLSLWPFRGHALVTTDWATVDHWRYELVRDRFTDTISCSMSRGAIGVRDGFVSFRLGESVDTSEAFYKIDAQPAQSWRALAPTLVEAGLKVQDDHLANASGGVVTLPLTMVLHASKVQIRPTIAYQVRTFSTDTLASAVDDGRRQGCDVDPTWGRLLKRP